jgi:hypothetical protein
MSILVPVVGIILAASFSVAVTVLIVDKEDE